MEMHSPPLPVKLLADDRVGDYMVDADGNVVDFNTHGSCIVRCVNSHEELLEAVKSFDLYIRNNESGDHGDCKLCKIIAKAEGQNA